MEAIDTFEWKPDAEAVACVENAFRGDGSTLRKIERGSDALDLSTRAIIVIVAVTLTGSLALFVVVERYKDVAISKDPVRSGSLASFNIIKRTEPRLMEIDYELSVELVEGRLPTTKQLQEIAAFLHETEKTTRSFDRFRVQFYAPGVGKSFAFAVLSRTGGLGVRMEADVVATLDDAMLPEELMAERKEARRQAAEVKAKAAAQKALLMEQQAKKERKLAEAEAAEKRANEEKAAALAEAEKQRALDEAKAKVEQQRAEAAQARAKQEQRAANLLVLAKKFLSKKRNKTAKRRLERILKEFPETEAATEAEQLLKEL